jgi:hypothetical protein
MKFTKELPKKEGYYWYTDGGEGTPTILEVTKKYKKFYASNEEFCFEVVKPPKGDRPEFWCYIPFPDKG